MQIILIKQKKNMSLNRKKEQKLLDMASTSVTKKITLEITEKPMKSHVKSF